MTDEELLSYKKVGPEVAAKYLQGGYTAHDLRLDAQEGICPFMTARRGKGRYSYTQCDICGEYWGDGYVEFTVTADDKLVCEYCMEDTDVEE